MTFPTQLISFITLKQDQTSVFNSFNTNVSAGIGTTDITVPDGVTIMSAVCIGGGGGGSGSDGNGNFGTAAGGGGGLTWGVFSVIPGDILRIQVGLGGNGGAASDTGNGSNGNTSLIRLISRNGSPVSQNILLANGGTGGSRGIAGGSGSGGTGGIGNQPVDTYVGFGSIFLSGGGNGGNGGLTVNDVGCGGGGAAGYRGNGGNGGTGTAVGTGNPTAAVNNSGGGGGGGGSSTLGYGGGGVGAYGYDGTTAGIAGTNSLSGGGGGSFFNDPGLGLVAAKIGEEIAVSGPGITTIAIPTDTQSKDFLLLLSSSDKDSGLTSMPVPVGFTTFNKTNNGVYYTTSTNYEAGGGIGTEAIAQNTPATFQQRDLNYANSYRYAPADFNNDPEGNISLINGRYCITGLTTYPAIHNLISLRYIPDPVTIQWAATSGDPSINTPPAPSMPQPPAVTGVAAGSLSIALGFLANTVLNPSNQIAGTGSNLTGAVSAGVGNSASGVMMAYMNGGPSGSNVTPPAFLTGTASHSRAYTLQINRSIVGTAISFVGAASTSTTSTINLNSVVTGGLQNGDLIICASCWDNPSAPNTPRMSSVNANNLTIIDRGTRNDTRQANAGLGFGVWYFVYDSSLANISTTLQNLTVDTGNTPATHTVSVFRNATISSLPAGWPSKFTSNPDALYGDVYDTDATQTVGAPVPPSLTTNSANSVLVLIGMIDDAKISNVTDITPPTGYTLLAKQSYGEQNNGAIIMSAIKFGLTAGSEDPSAFTGEGANIWASQTIILGGPGSQTGGTDIAAGQYGGGGGSRSQTSLGSGMNGAGGAVRLIWGSARQYPSANQGNAPVF